MPEWMLIASLILGLFNLVVVVLGVWFVWLQIRKTNLWNRRKYTMDEISRWDDSTFRDRRRLLNSVADPFESNPPSYESVADKLTSEHLDTIRLILNYFDGLGAGIRFGLLDTKMCHETLGINLDRYFTWAKPYVLECRKIEGRAWEEIDAMLLRWGDYDKKRKETNLPSGYEPL